jgi:hypothetical protein
MNASALTTANLGTVLSMASASSCKSTPALTAQEHTSRYCQSPVILTVAFQCWGGQTSQ